MYNDYNDRSMLSMERQEEMQSRAAIYLSKVMGWMCLGLFTTVVSSMLCLAIPQIYNLVFSSGVGIIGVCVVQLGLVMILSMGINRMSAGTATVMFMVYAAVTGLTMSVFVLVYDLASITLSFGVTAVIFLAMALYGITTQRDLSRLGSLLFFGLIGVILAGLVNMFLRSSMFDFLITCVGVVIFIGLIAYDTQKIKGIYFSAISSGYQDEDEQVRKLAIFGALSLYLDFINLFIRLLRILGRRRN